MNNDRFKFRAWNKKERKYYYDVENVYSDDSRVCSDIPDDREGCPAYHYCFGSLIEDPGYVIEQCTGLTDRNGRLIFEGDLLGESKEDDEFVEICWCGTLASFMCDIYPESYGNLETCDIEYLAKLEIIGNIHEMEIEK